MLGGDVVERDGGSDALASMRAQLAAIASTTRDLLDVEDATAMLDRIVDRVHGLSGADLTYLSVYDPATDELFVRAARGTRTTRFLGMRVPAGVGVASEVVRTRATHAVADYVELGALPRDPVIDEIVRDEGLHAILGAPLLASGDVLGVLFAANRTARRFDADDRALLTAFASHAAIVLRIAAVLDDLTASRHEAEEARERAERLAAETLSASRLHGRMTELIVQGRGPEDVVAALGAALERPVWAAGVQGEALWGTEPAPEAARAEIARAVAKSATTGRAAQLDRGPARAAIAVQAAGVRVASVLVGGSTPLSDVQRRTLERTAQILALVTMQRGAVAEAEERVRGELVLDLLESSDPVPAVRRARQRGIAVDRPWTTIAVRVAEADRTRAAARLRQLRSALVATVPEGCAVLMTGSDERTAVAHARNVLGTLRAVVVADGVESLVAANQGMRAAARAARLLRGLGVEDATATAADLAPYAAMFDDDGARARAFIDAAIGRVLEWDARRGTALVATLVALLEAQGSPAAASRALRVHVSTVKQRAGRLRALLGEGWETPEQRFRIEVAARLQRALEGLQRTSPMRPM